jgi:hypothetical protein
MGGIDPIWQCVGQVGEGRGTDVGAAGRTYRKRDSHLGAAERWRTTPRCAASHRADAVP